MDSHCAENEQSNWEANKEFLTKENGGEYDDEDAGCAKIKGKKHHCRLQKQ